MPAVTDRDIDDVLDLQRSAPADYWAQIMERVRRLDARRDAWRLSVRVADTPEAAQELPYVLGQLAVVGLEHEVTRDGETAGAQTITLTRRG
jgi:hypothetical protein